MSEPINITLAEPIKAHGEAVFALTIQSVRAKHIRLFGDPLIRASDGTSFSVDGGKMAALIGALAGIPISSVDQLSAPDYLECQLAVLSFFTPAAAQG